MISILLASYNGQRFIARQIDSILSQTRQDFILRISDDCSTDDTFSIAEGYAARYPDKIAVSRNTVNSGGAKGNFLKMMTEFKDDYVMLCDQDDIWFPDKIERTFLYMREMEASHGLTTPILVHADRKIADSGFNVIHASYRRRMSEHRESNLCSALVQNNVAGCTAMYNRALAELFIATPDFAVMHDWWLCIMASAFGIIGYLDEPTMLYIQHNENSLGAGDMKSARYIVSRAGDVKGVRKAIADTYLQAESFYNIYKSRLLPEQISLIKEYCSIPVKTWPFRVATAIKLGTLKKGFIRKVAHLLYM